MATVVLKEIRDSAIRVAIRLALGEFRIKGPQRNIMELESRVAWATVGAELQREGYTLIPPGEYAAEYGLAATAVEEKIELEGSLFALTFAGRGETLTLVPLAEHEEQEELGPIPV